ncbi:nuclear transport factor 2 family protein [Streptomyces sp. NPDC048385]|uniref:nuclear transport factor 2 family protein n=1 Tax=unclassified Streptomyces TaxID=2593676 RepID=UPI003428040A
MTWAASRPAPARHSQGVPARLTESAVVRLAEDWFAALDRRAPVADLLPLLVRRGLVLHLPEGVFREREGFRRWYAAASRGLAGGVHTLASVDVRLNDGPSAEIRLGVGRRGRRRAGLARRRAPAHDVQQIWTVVREEGAVRIRTCSVTGLSARPQTPA